MSSNLFINLMMVPNSSSWLCLQTACTVFDIVADPAFLQGVVTKGEKLKDSLRAATKGNSHVKEIRGVGLLVGVELDAMAGPVVDR